jgi:23S rRNA (adenine2503-C2)-methyltransferase
MMDINSLKEELKDEPRYRLKQVKSSIFKEFITDWGEATTLGKDLRQKLARSCPLDISAKLFESENKKTIKALITLDDDEKIETVLMKHKARNTVCVSTQVGCALGCKFCATGELGFKRDLTSSEIVNQALLFARILNTEEKKITNVVFMGMGEPFLNYDNVLEAIRVLHDPDGANLGARRFSISTSGIVEGINKLASENLEVNLAISLHAPNQSLREELMPIAKKYKLDDVMKVVDLYIQKTNRKVMFEYILIDGINDSDECAKELANLLKGKLCMVNLIPMNPVGEFKPSSRKRVKEFKRILERSGLTVVQRYSFGQDIKAACGQLACKD